MAKVKKLPRSIFQRILGIPATKPPRDPASWSYSAGKLTVDLSRATELDVPGGALRCEGGGLPVRVLVVRDDKGGFKAYRNRCTHIGRRRLDPVPGEGTVQCCSVNSTTFGMDGKTICGPGKHPLTLYPVTKEGGKLIIDLHNA